MSIPDDKALIEFFGQDEPTPAMKIRSLESRIAALQEEVERLTTQIDDIADECGCQEEVSNRHSHGRCIFKHLRELQDDYDKAVADNRNYATKFSALTAAYTDVKDKLERLQRPVSDRSSAGSGESPEASHD